MLHTHKVLIDDENILFGETDRRQLYFDYPGWKKIENEYLPSQKIINQIRKNMQPLSVDVFLGTWCSDSRREVPAFFKIIDESGIGNKMKINLWAVDRNKTLKNGLAQKCKIEFVPTFVFYESGKEIGRIVEMPEGLLEEDMLNIINHARK